MKFPFEASLEQIEREPEPYIDSVFSSLTSEFLTLPKGPGFIDYAKFEGAYENLKRATDGFAALDEGAISKAIHAKPIGFIVLRTMAGFTPSELAYLASERTGVEVTQSYARSLDRRIRMEPSSDIGLSDTTRPRFDAMVKTAVDLLKEGAPQTDDAEIHRLEKADTSAGLTSLDNAASLGLPYAMLLYERYLGRPFVGHRDSVSELIGNELEIAIEEELSRVGVSFRKTKRAEKLAGFDQAPDFIIPDEFNPSVVIEAKITEDDGTARDKVTRIQHLAELAEKDMPSGKRRFEVVACIGGRGFGVRREDMRKLVLATHGKVFTRKTLHMLAQNTQIVRFRSK